MVIRRRPTAKLLCMIFEQKLTWKDHIVQRKQSCTYRLGLLRTISHPNWEADRVFILRLYRAIVRTKLDYGAIIYNTAKETILKLLDPVHNKAIRVCSRAFRSSPIISLYAESGEPSLWTRRKQLALQFYHHVQTLPNSSANRCVQQQVLNQPIPATFMSFINNSCEALNMPAIHVAAAIQYAFPHWQATSPPICLNYIKDRKSDCNADSLRTIFLAHQYENHRDRVHYTLTDQKTTKLLDVQPSRMDVKYRRNSYQRFLSSLPNYLQL